MRQEKTIRIFISSTFRDMHSERDHLIRVVFPELRERCLKKGLHLVDVDLRWGVTEEEAERGKVLEICLDEIENCRPFFIGLLGERYGWVPEQYDVPDMARYDWVRDFDKGHSVTALEIYHGVLKNQAMKPRAFFYFRDPAFLSQVPENKRPDVAAENATAAGKLSALKNEIRQAFDKDNLKGHVIENYPCRYQGLRINWIQAKAELGKTLTAEDMALLAKVGGDDNFINIKEYALLNARQRAAIDQYCDIYLNGLEAFGEAVLQDLWQAIQEEHPDTEAAADPLAVEARHHRRFLEQRTRLFISREDHILADVEQYLKDGAVNSPLILSGAAGSGKSAVMAKAAMDWEQTHPDTCLISRFIGASPNSLAVDRLVLNIIETISRKFDLAFDTQDLVNMEKISEALRLVLRMAARKGRVVIFIDAVNQLLPTFNAHSLSWLPKRLPENVRMVVSTLPGAILEAAQKHALPVVALSSLTGDVRRHLVTDLLNVYRKRLGYDKQQQADQMALLLDKQDAGLPLYLTVACEELRVSPRFEEITARIRQFPGNTPDLFAQVLDRLENDHGRGLVTDALCLIASSRHGLLESELLELLKRDNEDRLPVNIWAQLSRSLSAYMRNTDENHEGLIGFFHEQLRHAVEKRYLRDEKTQRRYFQILADYGLAKYLQKTGDTANTILYTGIYLYQSEDGTRLYELLRDLFTLEDHTYQIYQGIAGTLFDWTVESFSYEGETTLKPATEKLAKDEPSINYSTFLNIKGTLFEKTGASPWAFFCFFNMMRVLEELVAKEPDRIDFINELSVSFCNVGHISRAMGDGKKALAFYEKSLRVLEDLVAKEPDQTDFRRNLSANFVNVGHICRAMGDGKKALAFYEKTLRVMEELVAKEPDRTDFRRDLSVSFGSLGNIYQAMGDGQKALAFYGKSLRVLEELVVKKPDRTDFRRDLSVSFDSVGNIYRDMGDGQKALAFFERSLRVRVELVEKEPDRTDFRLDLSGSFSNVGTIYMGMGDSQKALAFFEKSLRVIKDLVAKEPDRTDFRSLLSINFGSVGLIFQVMGDGQKALAFYEKSLRILEDLVAKEPDRTDFRRELSISFGSVGTIFQVMGDGQKALVFYEKSLRVMEELVAKESDRTDFRHELSISFNNVGNIYKAMGDGQKALSLFEKALRILEDLVAKEPYRADFRRDLSSSFNNVGNIYKAMGNGQKALSLFEKALRILEDLVAKEPDCTVFRHDLSSSFNNVGNIYKAMGDGQKALSLFEKALRILEDLVAKEPDRTDFRHDLSVSFGSVGHFFRAIGDRQKALAFYENSLRVMEELVAKESDRTDFRRDLSASFINVGYIYQAMGDGQKALAFYEKSLRVMEDLVAKEPNRTNFRHDLSGSYFHVGNIYRAMGDSQKALALFDKSLRVLEELVAEEPDRTDYRMDFAGSCLNMYRICPLQDRIKWLTTAKETMVPMIKRGVIHGQLKQLWEIVEGALQKTMSNGIQ